MGLIVSGHVENCLVEGSEHQSVLNGHAKQPGIRDLLVAVQAVEEWSGQSAPAVGDGVVVIARIAGEILQCCCGVAESSFPLTCTSGMAKEAGFAPGANGPLTIGDDKPVHYDLMMYMVFVEKSNQNIHVQ